MPNQKPSFDAPARVANEKKTALGFILPEGELPGLELEPKGLPFERVYHAETASRAVSQFELGRGAIRQTSTVSFDAPDRIGTFFGDEQRYQGINGQIRQKIDSVPHVQ